MKQASVTAGPRSPDRKGSLDPAADGGCASALSAGFLSLAVSIGIGRFVYTPILPSMINEIGLTKAQAGLIGSANFAGYLFGALIAIRPLPPLRRRLWLACALAICVVTLFAMALSSSLTAFVALRFVCGAASAVGFITATAIVLDQLTCTGRSNLVALHYAGVGSGIALAALVVSLTEQAGLGWRMLWATSALLSLAFAGLVVWLLRHSQPATLPAPLPSQGEGDASIARLILAYGLFGFGYVVTATFLVAIVRDLPSLHAIEAHVWFAVGLAAIPSVAAWSWVERRLGFRRSFALACLVEASGVLASVLDAGVPGIFYAAIALGGTFVALTSLGLDGARRLRPSYQQQTVAVMMAAFGTGQVLGPAAAGVLGDLTGGFTLPSLVATAALLTSASLVLSIAEARSTA